jgi:hypothetical protein
MSQPWFVLVEPPKVFDKCWAGQGRGPEGAFLYYRQCDGNSGLAFIQFAPRVFMGIILWSLVNGQRTVILNTNNGSLP